MSLGDLWSRRVPFVTMTTEQTGRSGKHVRKKKFSCHHSRVMYTTGQEPRKGFMTGTVKRYCPYDRVFLYE